MNDLKIRLIKELNDIDSPPTITEEWLGPRPIPMSRPKRVRPAPTERQKAYAKYLDSKEWTLLRDSALKAGGGRCIICSRTDRVQVHHLDYGTKGDWSDVGIESLVCLCNNHHLIYHASELLAELMRATPDYSRVHAMKGFFIGLDHVKRMRDGNRITPVPR